MNNLPLYKRIYYPVLGFVYGFTYWTDRHRFLGFRLSTGVKGLAFGPLVLVWQQNRSTAVLTLALLFGLWVLGLYWRAKRVGYSRFVEGETAVALTGELTPIPSNQRIPLKATGIFGVSDREERILLCPAEYWRAPLGDHTIMAQPEKGRFVYQFFDAASLRNFHRGWLIHGLKPKSVLAVTFDSVWGQDQMSLRELYQAADETNRKKKLRTIYLCFEDENDERAVWHTILQDAREIRKT